MAVSTSMRCHPVRNCPFTHLVKSTHHWHSAAHRWLAAALGPFFDVHLQKVSLTSLSSVRLWICHRRRLFRCVFRFCPAWLLPCWHLVSRGSLHVISWDREEFRWLFSQAQRLRFLITAFQWRLLWRVALFRGQQASGNILSSSFSVSKARVHDGHDDIGDGHNRSIVIIHFIEILNLFVHQILFYQTKSASNSDVRLNHEKTYS